MEFRLLGPVEVWDGDHRVPVGGARPRSLLTALLLEHGKVVPTARLIDAIWGDHPPPTARAVLQTYVATLRRRGLTQILTRAPGYLIDTDDIDLVACERYLARARAGAPADRSDLLRRALALWRGPALGGVDGDPLRLAAARLDEWQLSITEERIAADLAGQHHDGLVPELVGLVAAHPYRETLRGQLMVALARAGRQADALAAYQAGREVLVRDLGIEPGPALRAVHEAVLRGTEPELPVPRVVPRQLPSVPSDFTGRADQIAALTAALAPRGGHDVPLAVISGQGGTGKSVLAVRVGHELADRFPDGQLFAALHGMTDAPATAQTVLAGFLTALGSTRIPDGPAERVAAYRSLLAGRSVLVVLDDAASEAQVRPLLPGGSRCAVLVTARSRLPGLAGSRRTELDVMDESEAVALLTQIAGAPAVTPPQAAAQLVRLCGRLPLAVRIVGARLATRRHWTLADLCARLADERGRLDQLSAGDLQVRASIGLSYAALDPPARTALLRLGHLGLSEFPGWVVAALVDRAEGADDLLDQLIDAQFVAGAGAGWYRMHDLLRIFAADRALADEAQPVRDAAVRRVLDGWIALVDGIGAAHPSGTISIRTPAAAGAGGQVADPRGWFAANQHALVASVERAAALDLDDVAAGLASALCGSLFATDNRFDAWTRTHHAALATVRRQGNRRAEAWLLSEFGQLRYEQDRYAEARTYLLQALTAFRDTGDARGEGATLVAIGIACRDQGYLPESLHFLGRARDILTGLDDAVALAPANRALGLAHLERGDFGAAQQSLYAALVAFRRTGGRRGEAMTLRSVSLLHRARGDYAGAADLADQALGLFRGLGDELLTAYCLQAVAKAGLRLGRYAPAREMLAAALATCRRYQDRWGEALTLRTTGELELAEGRLAAAEGHLLAAAGIWRTLDLHLPLARTLRDLAVLRRRQGDTAEAERVRARAAATFALYGARERFE